MNTLMRIGLCGTASAALILGVAPLASAEIVIGDGMAGVSLGMTKAQVKSVLGKPKKVEKGKNDFGKYQTLFYKGKVRITLTDNSVSSTWTRGTQEKTDKGVGVGSSKKQVKNKVPGVKCQSFSGSVSCHVGKFKAGQIVTDFQMDNGHVKTVTVGVVID